MDEKARIPKKEKDTRSQNWRDEATGKLWEFDEDSLDLDSWTLEMPRMP
jgi:hypothetical protein